MEADKMFGAAVVGTGWGQVASLARGTATMNAAICENMAHLFEEMHALHGKLDALKAQIDTLNGERK
jgi:hypothetical protein